MADSWCGIPIVMVDDCPPGTIYMSSSMALFEWALWGRLPPRDVTAKIVGLAEPEQEHGDEAQTDGG